MEEVFKPILGDEGLVITAIREANILLASLDKQTSAYYIKKGELYTLINIFRNIESYRPQYDKDIKEILNDVNKLYNTGLLSPLTLNDDEFGEEDINGYRSNNRYPYIKRCINVVYNTNAYKCIIKHIYNDESKVEVPHVEFETDKEYNGPLYIYKGGVITGDYIHHCIIRKSTVDKHCFPIQSIINIPVSVIGHSGTKDIYIVDHREPKLKILQEFYEVPIYHDDDIEKSKYDIRKYKKL